jgi:uncharacterized protein involved in type VI secretion and phage assembly
VQGGVGVTLEAFSTGRHDGSADGVAVGTVTDDADPDGRGRVAVTFPERDDDGDHWARVAVPMAGDASGTYYQPAVGDEVLVAFAGGDVHRPYVVGSLWNGQRSPPRDNSGGENTVREVRSRSGHTVAFDDGEEGSLTVRTAAGHEIVLDDGDDTLTVSDAAGDNRVELDAANGTATVEADGELALSASTIRLDGEEVQIDAERSAAVSSGGQLTLDSGGQLSVSSTAGIGVESTGVLTLEGALIQLN